MAAGILTGVGTVIFPSRIIPTWFGCARSPVARSAPSITRSDQSAVGEHTEMKIAAVHAVRRTAVGTGLVLVVVVALVLGARGCATTAVGATPQPGEASLAYASPVFGTPATTAQVARAAGAESLAPTPVSAAQVAPMVSPY